MSCKKRNLQKMWKEGALPVGVYNEQEILSINKTPEQLNRSFFLGVVQKQKTETWNYRGNRWAWIYLSDRNSRIL